MKTRKIRSFCCRLSIVDGFLMIHYVLYHYLSSKQNNMESVLNCILWIYDWILTGKKKIQYEISTYT